MVKKRSLTHSDLHYFVSGENPKLLIHTGTHGDEWHVISLVKSALRKYESKLPPFIYFPEVSPSAVKVKTRVNGRGKDMNRIFFSGSKDPEVIEHIRHLKNKRFDLVISFHEDLDAQDYYVYDHHIEKLKKEVKLIINHHKRLMKFGIKLFNGIDDPKDRALGNKFKNGYKSFTHRKDQKNNGMITTWALQKSIADRCLVPEIPGKLPHEKKKFIIESFFEEILLGF